MTREALIVAVLSIALPSSAQAVQARSLPIEYLRSRVEDRADRSIAAQPAFREEAVQFTIASGKVLTARLLVPSDEPKGKRLPVLSVFGGFEQAAEVIDLFQPPVPLIVASFDYPFDASRKFEFPASLKHASEAKRAIKDMLSAIEELHSVLKHRDDVDPLKITIVGASFGAPFALAAAANDPTITGVIVVHGFGDVPGTMSHKLALRWRHSLGSLARPVAWLLSNIGWLYLRSPAPESSALRLTSRQRVLMLQAKQDPHVPTAASDALWAAVESSAARSERRFTPGDHVQPTEGGLVETIVEQIIGWMGRSDLL